MEKPIRDYEPCPLYYLDSRSPRNTICNDIRDIYHKAEAILKKGDYNNAKIMAADIMLLARIAMSKSKAMMERLQKYNKESSVELFPGEYKH